MDVPGDVLACLPAPVEGPTRQPSTPTLWSKGSSVYTMVERRAIRQGRSKRRAAQKATEAARQYSRAMTSTDPKLWGPCCVKVTVLRKTTSTNTEDPITAQASVGTNTEDPTSAQSSVATDTADLPAPKNDRSLAVPALPAVETATDPTITVDARNNAAGKISRGPRCFNCHSFGHRHRKCPEPRRKFCTRCGATGHLIHQCHRYWLG